MSNFKFRGAKIEAVRFDSGNSVVATISAWRGKGIGSNATCHTVEIRCCPGAMHQLMEKYVEACNYRLAQAEGNHRWNKERVAKAWNAFARTAGEVKP
jgi:hypothetical protein